MVKKRISRDHSAPRATPIDQHDGDERAGVEQPHVLREEEIGHAEALVPGKAARAPEIDLRVHRAEQVGEHEREQMGPVQRAAPGLDEGELGPVRASASSSVSSTGSDDDATPGDAAGDQRREAGAQARAQPVAASQCASTKPAST